MSLIDYFAIHIVPRMYRGKGALHPADVGALFLTHADPDHAGGLDIRQENHFKNADVYLGISKRTISQTHITVSRSDRSDSRIP